MGLNPSDKEEFVAVYIKDVLVSSCTLENLEHLRRDIDCLQQAGLKLKPTKYLFVQEEVEYLGHLITPQDLKPNPKLVEAVREFSAAQNLKQLRQFLGLSSYYRRFIPKENTAFEWDAACQEAFETLKRKLTEAPILAYPSFHKNFALETDASIQGIGAVLTAAERWMSTPSSLR